MGAPKLRPGLDEDQLAALFARAEEIGLKLELTDAGITWEAFPGTLHQRLVFSIQTSLRSGRRGDEPCGCRQIADVDIAFLDGTVKRPDISVWCDWPREQEGFVHQIPEAVIEVVSPGYEAKDLVDGPPLYLRNGVKDVIVLDRVRGEVHHWRGDDHRVVPSPTVFDLQCGCQVTV